MIPHCLGFVTNWDWPIVGEKVRRERRWTPAGATPARELVRSTRLAIEAAVEAAKLSEPSMERVIMGDVDNGQRLLGLRLGVFYTVAV
jgi:hypothetical protein